MTDTQAVHAPPVTEIEPCGDLCIRTLAMPANTNQNGDIFGGWLLSQMDLAGGVFASKAAKARTVTVAIEAMNFRKPVFIGEVRADGQFNVVWKSAGLVPGDHPPDGLRGRAADHGRPPVSTCLTVGRNDVHPIPRRLQ